MSEPFIVQSDEYGEEVIVRTETGRELRSGAGAVGDSTVTGDYVRVLDSAGIERGYWTYDEWRDDPQVVMGAIIGCLLGLRSEEPRHVDAAPDFGPVAGEMMRYADDS